MCFAARNKPVVPLNVLRLQPTPHLSQFWIQKKKEKKKGKRENGRVQKTVAVLLRKNPFITSVYKHIECLKNKLTENIILVNHFLIVVTAAGKQENKSVFFFFLLMLTFRDFHLFKTVNMPIITLSVSYNVNVF